MEERSRERLTSHYTPWGTLWVTTPMEYLPSASLPSLGLGRELGLRKFLDSEQCWVEALGGCGAPACGINAHSPVPAPGSRSKSHRSRRRSILPAGLTRSEWLVFVTLD